MSSNLEIQETSLKGVKLIKPRIFGDARGFFYESWNKKNSNAIGITGDFVQDNVSRSCKNTVRGLHLQHPNGQGKLVSVLEGSVLDVAVDVRVGSPTFGKWVGCELNADNKLQLWIPPGFAHGFCVLSESALFSYKCTDYYAPDRELCVLWNDPAIGIDWNLRGEALLSEKDKRGLPLATIAAQELPQYEPLNI